MDKCLLRVPICIVYSLRISIIYLICTLYTFYKSNKIKVSKYIFNCSCNWTVLTVQEFTNLQFVGMRNKWHVFNIYARAAKKLGTSYILRKCLHVGLLCTFSLSCILAAKIVQLCRLMYCSFLISRISCKIWLDVLKWTLRRHFVFCFTCASDIATKYPSFKILCT